jgi:hypothetical protein
VRLCAGAATDYRDCGVTPERIIQLGRWTASQSDAWERYSVGQPVGLPSDRNDARKAVVGSPLVYGSN